MNRKIITSILGLLFCVFSLHATLPSSNKINWGVKATVDAELPSNWRNKNASIKMFNSGFGFTIGAVSNIPLGSNFYMEPGVAFFYSQYPYELQIGAPNTISSNPMLSKYGLEIPVVFGYTFKFSDRFGMRVFTGPQLRAAIGGNVGIKDKEMKKEYEGLLLWDSFRRFDVGWKIGLGFPIDNFVLSLDADLGMNNLLKPSELTGKTAFNFRENRIALGVTYFF